MIEELQHVDDSILTSLIELRHERDALRQRLARMQESASKVSEPVLARVRGDYEARIAALDAKASPLKDAARGAFGRLKPLLDEAQGVCETLRLDQEEVELRHSLGEFDDDVHREKAAQITENLRGAQERSAEISALAARFAAAFDSPDELAPASTSQIDLSAAAADPAPAPASTAPMQNDNDGTQILPPEPPPAPTPPAAPPLPADSPEPPLWLPGAAWSASATAEPARATTEELWRAATEAPVQARVEAPVEAQHAPAAAETATDASAPEAPAEPEAATSGIPARPEGEREPAPRARLEALDGDLDPQPHYLEPLTFIGRTPENQVRIYKPAVSRRHAQITESASGWLLRDLSSENGTYVNGQRINEHLLADGDRVQFGTSRFVVRLTS